MPVLFIEQKPPKLFAEIELKERGEKADTGGSYRCPTFEPPKVEYESDISSGNSDRIDNSGSGSQNDGGTVVVSEPVPNVPPQTGSQQASASMYPSPFTPVLPPAISAHQADGGSQGSNNAIIVATDDGSADNTKGQKSNDNNGSDNSDGGNESKFTGNFKKTSEGKIVVKDASGNEIHF